MDIHIHGKPGYIHGYVISPTISFDYVYRIDCIVPRCIGGRILIHTTAAVCSRSINVRGVRDRYSHFDDRCM